MSGSGATSDAPAVTVYSTAFCVPCEHLKNHLGARGVEFELKDPMMDEDAAEFLEDRDIRSTPVLVVADEVLIGYDARAVDDLLASRGFE